VRTFRDLRAAFGWLTVLPVGTTALEAHPIRFFPLVGLGLGLAGGLVAAVGARLTGTTLAELLVGVLVVGAWAVLTRLLHWDGLADCADGLLGGATPERRLEIMRDSHVGAFGALAIGFVLLLQVVAIATLVASGDILEIVLVPVVGRAAASFALWTNTPARADGLARTLAGHDGVRGWVVAALPLLVLLARPERATAPVVLGGLLLAFLVPRALASRVGGVTGDIVGASVLLVESAVLVAFVLGRGLS